MVAWAPEVLIAAAGDPDLPPPPPAVLAALAGGSRPGATTAGAARLNLGGVNAASGVKALAEELALVEAAPEGQRNHTLNRTAFRLLQLVGGGFLPEAEVLAKLAMAGAACGLPSDEVARTIASGLAAGMRHPRAPAPREDWRGPERRGEGRGAALETGGRDPAGRGSATGSRHGCASTPKTAPRCSPTSTRSPSRSTFMARLTWRPSPT